MQRSRSLFLQPKMAWLLAGMLLFPLAAWQAPPEPDPVALRAQGPLFTPREFYISHIADERQDRKAVAMLVPSLGSTAPQAVDLQGGGQAALAAFIRQSVPVNKSLRPVVLKLQQCQVKEKLLDNGLVEGQLSLTLAFEVQAGGKTLLSLPYKSGARYQRQRQTAAPLAASLEQSLAGALRYFNTWINREAASSEKLARSLRLSFRDHTANEDPDTLFYHPARPLRWEDFRAQPRPGPYAAAVFPSFSYEGRSRVADGILHLDLTMKVFVVRDASWVRFGRDALTLNHEQRHFDIVKLVAERFKQQAQSKNLTVADYNSQLQYQFLESWRQMTALQEQYDRETRHGLDAAAQQRWNQQIDRDLLSLGAKK
ncbi:MAG: DUF922 domain-containing protein [Adhaeribacter sp.]